VSRFSYGFRIVGPCSGERRLTVAAVAFDAYANCDERANVNREAYLSAFCFADDLDIASGFQQRAQPFANNGVVVSKQHRDGFHRLMPWLN